MAIADDVLKVEELIVTEEGDVNKESDTESKEASLADKIAAGVGKVKQGISGLLNQLPKAPVKTNIDLSKTSLGIFSDFICCTMPNRKKRHNTYINAFDRRLFGISYKDICGRERVLNPFDVALKTAVYVKTIKDMFDGNTNTLLNVLKMDLGNKMRALGLSKDIMECVLGNSLRSIYGRYGYYGSSLRDRGTLRGLMSQDPCVRALMSSGLLGGTLGVVNTWIARANGSAMISMLIKGQPDKALQLMVLSMASPDTRALALMALGNSMNTPGDTSKKIGLLGKLFQLGVLQPKDYINISINTKVVIENLSKEEKTDIEFSVVLDTLKRIDPQFREDIDNNNFSKLSSCQHLLPKENMVKEINIEGRYKTKLTPTQIIMLTSSKKRTKCLC